MKKYKFIEHTADIAAELEADSHEELFTAAADAWKEAALHHSDDKGEKEKRLSFSEKTYEDLMVSFISELNYLVTVHDWVFTDVKKLVLTHGEKFYELFAEVEGEQFDGKKERLKEEIKAVTYHKLEIKKEENKYRTTIVFDI